MRIQYCAHCGEETGRCEEDSIYLVDYGPLCEICYDNAVEELSEVKQRDYD